MGYWRLRIRGPRGCVEFGSGVSFVGDIGGSRIKGGSGSGGSLVTVLEGIQYNNVGAEGTLLFLSYRCIFPLLTSLL